MGISPEGLGRIVMLYSTTTVEFKMLGIRMNIIHTNKCKICGYCIHMQLLDTALISMYHRNVNWQPKCVTMLNPTLVADITIYGYLTGRSRLGFNGIVKCHCSVHYKVWSMQKINASFMDVKQKHATSMHSLYNSHGNNWKLRFAAVSIIEYTVLYVTSVSLIIVITLIKNIS